MVQRSLHVVTEVYYKSMSCFATVPPQASLAVLRLPPRRPLLHHVGWTNHHASSHSSEQGTQHIVLLISRQAIPYRTRDGTCCPGLPTPKIRYKLLQHYLPLSSIPGEGEYRPPLEDCLRASGSLSEALASTSNKTLLIWFLRTLICDL
jgi:hypothetical protein